MSPQTALEKMDTATLEAIAEAVLDVLDARQGDTDKEPDEEGCCEAGDDVGSKDQRAHPATRPAMPGYAAGDPDDAEEDDAPEEDDPAEADHANQSFGTNGTHEYAVACMARIFERGAR